jgi:hypothetical protein
VRIPVDLRNTIQLLYSGAHTTPTLSADDAVAIKRGVLQGGVLSPDLFNYYIDDLSMQLKRDNYLHYYYADDLAVIVHGEAQVKRLVRSIEDWCRRNFMSLNKAKCGAMFLAGHSTLSADELRQKTVEGVPIVAKYKYLGVYLQKNLQPSAHLDFLKEKLKKF